MDLTVELRAYIEHLREKAEQYLERAKKAHDQMYFDAAKQYALSAKMYKDDKETVQDILNYVKKGDLQKAASLWYNLPDDEDLKEEFPYSFKQAAKEIIKQSTQARLNAHRASNKIANESKQINEDKTTENKDDIKALYEIFKQLKKLELDSRRAAAIAGRDQPTKESKRLQDLLMAYAELTKIAFKVLENLLADKEGETSELSTEAKSQWGKDRLEESFGDLGEESTEWFLTDGAKEDYANVMKTLEVFPDSKLLKLYKNYLTKDKQGRLGLTAAMRRIVSEYLAKMG